MAARGNRVLAAAAFSKASRSAGARACTAHTVRKARRRPMIIGLTGGIASGKTLVSDYLKGARLSRCRCRSTLARGHGSAGDAGGCTRCFWRRRFLRRWQPRPRRPCAPRVQRSPGAAKARYHHPSSHRKNWRRRASPSTPERRSSFSLCRCFTKAAWTPSATASGSFTPTQRCGKKRLMARDAIDADYARQKIAAQMSEEERLAPRAARAHKRRRQRPFV